jgi:hypothetical protein
LTQKNCYAEVLAGVIDWTKRVVLIVDESSQDDRVHLFRVSLAYRGTSLPLAWDIWEANTAQPEGHYWQQVDRVLAQVAEIVPSGLDVLVLADRAYDIPAFVDRISTLGWHWIVRCKAQGQLRFRDHQGREWALRDIVHFRLSGPGRRYKSRGQVFKKAGWRSASVVGVWALGQKEPLVVLTDLSPRWEVLDWYGRRFWMECGFRNDKSRGWRWENSQVQGIEHNRHLLLGMAWASLVVLCLGTQAAKGNEIALRGRHCSRLSPGRPQHARFSLFSLGLQRARSVLYQALSGAVTWLLYAIGEVAWNMHWYRAQSLRFIFNSVRP